MPTREKIRTKAYLILLSALLVALSHSTFITYAFIIEQNSNDYLEKKLDNSDSALLACSSRALSIQQSTTTNTIVKPSNNTKLLYPDNTSPSN